MAGRVKPPKLLAGAAPPGPEADAPRYFSTNTVTAYEMRAELQRVYQRLADRDRSDGEMARVRALLGLPDAADVGDVLEAIRMLQNRQRKDRR